LQDAERDGGGGARLARDRVAREGELLRQGRGCAAEDTRQSTRQRTGIAGSASVRSKSSLEERIR
jgi:hypothetical protein